MLSMIVFQAQVDVEQYLFWVDPVATGALNGTSAPPVVAPTYAATVCDGK